MINNRTVTNENSNIGVKREQKLEQMMKKEMKRKREGKTGINKETECVKNGNLVINVINNDDNGMESVMRRGRGKGWNS